MKPSMPRHYWFGRLMRLNRALLVWSAICAAFLASVLSFCCLVLIFRFLMQDCAPGQIDGQCGLATFVALIFALFGALAVWVVASIAISIWLLRRKKRDGSESSQTMTRLLNS